MTSHHEKETKLNSSSHSSPVSARANIEMTSILIVQILFFIADFCFFVLSVLGNAVVIYVISRDKKLKSKSNFHILSVAVADLLIGLFGIPFGVVAVSLLC